MESGVVADTQLSASSVWEWTNVIGEHSVWAPSGARLKREGRPWSPAHNDQYQWLQVDLKREKRITGGHSVFQFSMYPIVICENVASCCFEHWWMNTCNNKKKNQANKNN